MSQFNDQQTIEAMANAQGITVQEVLQRMQFMSLAENQSQVALASRPGDHGHGHHHHGGHHGHHSRSPSPRHHLHLAGVADFFDEIGDGFKNTIEEVGDSFEDMGDAVKKGWRATFHKGDSSDSDSDSDPAHIDLCSVSLPVSTSIFHIGRRLTLEPSCSSGTPSTHMAAVAFQLEKKVAISAVLRACELTSSVFNQIVNGETFTKDDKSPVTVADFSAQAVVNTILQNTFPNDPIIGEEDSSDLRTRTPEVQNIRDRLHSLANAALRSPLKQGEDATWGIGPSSPPRSIDQLLNTIDRGNFQGHSVGRMWTLDPIDGTKGFLLGEQYAVCLALIVDSVVQVGVIGCPNLPVDPAKPDGDRGCLFVAVRNQGSEQRSLRDPLSPGTPLKLHSSDLSTLALLESREGAHSSHDLSSRIAQKLGLTAPPLRMDSQAKYCALARGEGGIYLRLPVPGKNYVEKIWDHASGSLLVTEAGGVISDTRGQPLNFGFGRTLGPNYGIVATLRDVHPKVIAAVNELRADDLTKCA